MVTAPLTQSEISDNIDRIKEQINSAALSAGRETKDIKLIAVSKTRPLAAVQDAISTGQIDFGENTIQDARSKIDHLPGSPAIWHFIGHLQSNKAKFMPGRFAWLHTLDSLALAKKLNQSLSKADKKISVLIQVNVANDSAKHGITSTELPGLIEKLLEEKLDCIQLKGLMTIGKADVSLAEQSKAFDDLRELQEKTSVSFILPDFSELSMGMSKDFIQAIESGSTMVRVGSEIFGVRE